MNKFVLLMVLVFNTYAVDLVAQVKKTAPARRVATSVQPQTTITKYSQLGEDGYVWVKVKKGNLFGAQSVEGKDIIPAIFDDVVYECRNYKENFSDWNLEMSTKWFRVKSGDNIGLYSIEGNCLVSPERYHSNYRVGVPTLDTHYMGKMFLYIIEDKKEGVLDVQGREVIPPIYDYIYYGGGFKDKRMGHEGKEYKTFMIVDKTYDKWGYTDLNGNVIWHPSENKLGGVCSIRDDTGFYISKRIKEGSPGEWADVKCNYDENIKFDYSRSSPIFGNYYTKLYDSSISTIDGRTFYVKNENGYRSVMDTDQNIIIPSSRGYTQVNMYGTGNENWGFYILKGGKWGIADNEGKEIILPQYDAINVEGLNRAKFGINGAWGLMDLAGNTIIPIDRGYSSIEKFGEANYYKVGKSGRYGIVDLEGKEIVPTELETLESAGTGYLRYKLNGFWGLMDYACNILIDTDRGYTSIGDFKTFNKRFPYTMNGYKGECDATGRQISKIKIETPLPSTESKTTVEVSEKVELFPYYSYVPIKNGQLDLANYSKSTIDGVAFDFSSTGKIVVKMMNKENAIESMTIYPQDATLYIESNVIKITFTENGISKAISIMKTVSRTDAKKCIMWTDDNSSSSGKLFGEMGGGKDSTLGVLLDFVSQYMGSDFDGQFNRIKTEFNKYSWKKTY